MSVVPRNPLVLSSWVFSTRLPGSWVCPLLFRPSGQPLRILPSLLCLFQMRLRLTWVGSTLSLPNAVCFTLLGKQTPNHWPSLEQLLTQTASQQHFPPSSVVEWPL